MPSLSDFKNSFGKDLARQNRFMVYIPFPEVMALNFGNNRIMSYRCENAQLPGKTFATTEQKIYGPIEKHPYLVTYNDIDLTFILDDDMETKKMFDDWLNYINPTTSNDYRYRQEYQTDLTVNQYSLSDDLTYSVQLHEAYPISMNQLDLDWSSEGYHKLTVTFAYTYWTSTGTPSVMMGTPTESPPLADWY